MDTEFKREERYIVVKIKDIDNQRQLEKLRYQIHQGCGVNTVECVVVESDWPEYETVWKMIQDRIEGRPNELATSNERIRDLDEELRIARQGAEYAFQQAKEADANATIQFEARRIIESALSAEREVSDKLEKALQRIADTYFSEMSVADYHIITAALAEVSRLRSGPQPLTSSPEVNEL